MVGDSCHINDSHVNVVWPSPWWHSHKTQDRVFVTILLHIVLFVGEGVGNLHHWGFVDRGMVIALFRIANRYVNATLWFLNIAPSFLVFV